MVASEGSFQTPIDIANRALQHCGVQRISSFSDNTVQAAEVAFVYDKVRRAELRRNVWRFATRRAVLYPISQPNVNSQVFGSANAQAVLPTMRLVPGQWDPTFTYGQGSIVQDSSGQIWVSTIDNNLNQAPNAIPGPWDVYFGSMCAQPYDISGSTAYYDGDIVYQAVTTGLNQAYVSTTAQNQTSPLAPTVWSPTAAYNSGDVVQDSVQGYFWRSCIDLNYGNAPGVYQQWVSGTDTPVGWYAVGSDFSLYQCLAPGNATVNPVNDTTGHWKETGYAIGSFELWNFNTIYPAGALIADINGFVYWSVAGFPQSGHNPTTDTGTFWQRTGWLNRWTPAFCDSTANDQWRLLKGAGITGLNINYPLGSGPAEQTFTRNAFMLPNGFLRQAPDDPKAGSTSFLGAPVGNMYKDWVFESNFIVSRQVYPIILRFVADVVNVPEFDDMFCEMLACRIALEVCERLTQSGSKLAAIAQAYQRFGSEARTVNGIETGSVEPPEDDYISCRI